MLSTPAAGEDPLYFEPDCSQTEEHFQTIIKDMLEKA